MPAPLKPRDPPLSFLINGDLIAVVTEPDGNPREFYLAGKWRSAAQAGELRDWLCEVLP
jgi:hypothetical protein